MACIDLEFERLRQETGVHPKRHIPNVIINSRYDFYKVKK